MNFVQACLLFFAAIVGGTLNSVAGGGSFFTGSYQEFPAGRAGPRNSSNFRERRSRPLRHLAQIDRSRGCNFDAAGG